MPLKYTKIDIGWGFAAHTGGAPRPPSWFQRGRFAAGGKWRRGGEARTGGWGRGEGKRNGEGRGREKFGG